MRKNKDFEWELTRLISNIAGNQTLLHKFLEDLLSPYELIDVATRWQIVKQLNHKIPNRRIAKNLHVGIATITRGSRVLQNKDGGFNQVLKRYGNKNF